VTRERRILAPQIILTVGCSSITSVLLCLHDTEVFTLSPSILFLQQHTVSTDTMNRLRDSKLTKGNPAPIGGDNYDAIVTRLANEDKVPWYRKPNLRHLYFMLIPTCMGNHIGFSLTNG
jgi:hypothetical protein